MQRRGMGSQRTNRMSSSSASPSVISARSVISCVRSSPLHQASSASRPSGVASCCSSVRQSRSPHLISASATPSDKNRSSAFNGEVSHVALYSLPSRGIDPQYGENDAPDGELLPRMSQRQAVAD